MPLPSSYSVGELSGTELRFKAKQQAKLSRLLNPYAHKSALEQPTRWHLVVRKDKVISFVATGFGTHTKWKHGPVVTLTDLGSSERCQALASQVAGSARKPWSGVGIIVHAAAHISVTDVTKGYGGVDRMQEAARAAVETPGEIVLSYEERKHGDYQWRVCPLLAHRSRLIGINLRPFQGFEALGSPESKFRVWFACAPLEMLAIALDTSDKERDRDIVLCLHYDAYVIVACWKSNVGIVSFDYVPLETRSDFSSGSFADKLGTNIDSASLVQPLLYVLQCGEQDPTSLAAGYRGDELAEDPRIVDEQTWQDTLKDTYHLSSEEVDFAVRPEAIYCNRSLPEPMSKVPLDKTVPSELTRLEAAARQNFWYANAAARSAILPASVGLAMAGSGLLRAACGILSIPLLLWLGFLIVTAALSPRWHLSAQEAQIVSAELTTLEKTQGYLTTWQSLFKTRSATFSSLDLLAGMVPASDNLVCQNAEYSFRSVQDSVTRPGAPSANGFERRWTISGECDEESLRLLNALVESDNLKDQFHRASSRTGDSSLEVSNGRSVTGTVKDDVNPTSNVPGGSRLPKIFTLDITEHFAANDSLQFKSPLPAVEAINPTIVSSK